MKKFIDLKKIKEDFFTYAKKIKEILKNHKSINWKNILTLLIGAFLIIAILLLLYIIFSYIFYKILTGSIDSTLVLINLGALIVMSIFFMQIIYPKHNSGIIRQKLFMAWFLLGIFVGSIFFKFHLSRYVKLESLDKYTLLVDMILILIAFATLIWFAVYATLKKEIKDDQNKDIENGRHFTEAQMFKLAGLLSFNNYATFFHATHLRKLTKDLNHLDETKKNNEEEINKCVFSAQFYINDAISKTEQALRVMALVDSDKKTDKDRIKIFNYMCENNIGWYLAEKGDEDEKDRIKALSFAEKIKENIKKYPYDEVKNWSDTIEFINKVFIKK